MRMSTNDRWEKRVQQLEAEGLTRSDAQAVADAEAEKLRSQTKMSHTPGPWHINAVDSKRGQVVGDETTTAPYDKLQINNYNATVATVYRPKDARLIAAAPELLEAAKGLLNEQGHLPECERVYCKITCKAIRAAIAKAEGKSNA